ncbi:MAG: tetratricopeptide repeat protein [Candidatus Limnocylindria bacterium]
MSDAPYERYKDALRRGHAAALRGRHAAAIDAYSEAAGIAPDRALPLVGLGTALARLGRTGEALTALDAALERAPDDESALRARADLLGARGDRSGAADTLDRLAAVLERAGRLPDATDAARRALELAESRPRRRTVSSLTDRLRASESDPAAAAAIARALDVLEGRVAPARGSAAAGAEADGGGDRPPEDAAPAAPFEPAEATRAVEVAADAGDDEALVVLALQAALGHGVAGSHDAAIDACYLALGVSPADARLHLALAGLYLDRGWRSLAVDKLVLLRRLATLTDDAATLERVAAMAAERLPGEARLAAPS